MFNLIFVALSIANAVPPCGPVADKAKWACTKNCEAEFSCEKVNRADVVRGSDRIYEAIEGDGVEIAMSKVLGLEKGDRKRTFKKKTLEIGHNGTKGKLVCFMMYEKSELSNEPVETGYHYCDFLK